jgi:hypothetical protein
VIRRLLIYILNLRMLAFARVILWYCDALSDQRATTSFAAGLQGVRLLESAKSRLFDHRRGTTLFILGSGQSVNELNECQLQMIKEHASIGINYWFLHSLVPSIYALEGHPKQYGALTDQQLLARERLAVRASAQLATESSPAVLHLRPANGARNSLFPLSDLGSPRTYLYGRANVIARTAESLKLDLKLLVFLAKNGLLRPAVLPDNGASVVRLIFLGIAQGFRDIVLVGVDLDDRPHFYFSDQYSEYHQDLTTVNPQMVGASHETRESLHRPFDTLEFLAALAEVLNAGKAPRLWVGAASSQLSTALPVYPWEGAAE